MIKVTNIVAVESVNEKTKERLVRADLIADESVEVEDIGNNGASVVGLSDKDKLAMGSTCFTASMEFGMLDSTGNWRFQ